MCLISVVVVSVCESVCVLKVCGIVYDSVQCAVCYGVCVETASETIMIKKRYKMYFIQGVIE